MPKNIYAKVCAKCGFDNAGDALGVPCRNCQSRDFLLEFRGPMSVSAGMRVDFPVYSKNPKQAVLTTEGDGEVTLGGTKKSYAFALFPKIRKKNGDNWVQIANRKDQRGLDVLFGSRQGERAHAHYCYEVGPSMIYLRNLADTQLIRKHLFDRGDGSVLPIEDEIKDSTTGMSLFVVFALKDNQISIATVEFVPTQRATPNDPPALEE